MENLIQFALLVTGIYYVVARADITEPFWGPLDGVPFFGPLLRCPACSGTWIGALLGHFWPLVHHDHEFWSCLTATVVHALFGMVLTALGWGLMKTALDYGAVTDKEE